MSSPHITTAVSGGGREDAAHAAKDAEVEHLRAEIEQHKASKRALRKEKAQLNTAHEALHGMYRELERERAKTSTYAAALFRDHAREREALWKVEQMALSSAEMVPEHEQSYRYMADVARKAIRNYKPGRLVLKLDRRGKIVSGR